MNFSHEKMPQFMPTVTFSDPAMFVRGWNDFNDSRQSFGKVTLDPLSADHLALFQSRFNIDAAKVRQVFSAG